MAYRKTARPAHKIQSGIRTVLAHARKDLKAIHLVPADYRAALRKPLECGVTEKNGRLVVSHHGRLIDVLPASEE